MNKLLLAALLACASVVPAAAQTADTNQGTSQSTGASTAAPGNAADLTEGEVRRIDKTNSKITIRHGEIKNLEMPGMTMVFQVTDPAMLDTVKVGDKVRFHVEKQGGAMVVTQMQAAQ